MDNKYGLGSTKVATEHHETHHKTPKSHDAHCKFCGSIHLEINLAMHDHQCTECGEWQNDIPQDYSTGRSSNY